MIETAPQMNTAEMSKGAADWDAAHVMRTYARQPVQFVRGNGMFLYDADGKEYMDFLAGIAVCSIGHSHPYLTRAIQEQAATLLHVSNLYLTEPQARLARRLIELSDMERVFFCNSGAEANEAALKIARKRGSLIAVDKTDIVTAQNSFHGRTIATVTATGQPKYSAPFAPLPGGFHYVAFNDIAALTAQVNEHTAAILLEPIQGEGGIIPATSEYLQAARALADRYDALLLFDEVQTGVGRTGKMWAYQRYGVVPDIMTLAKGLGGGIPIGACLARGSAADVFQPGDHGSTFAGNPLAATAANAVLDVIADDNLLRSVRETGDYLATHLALLKGKQPEIVGDLRGMGLMLGLALKVPIAKKVVAEARERGLIVNAPNEDTIRLLPPLIVTKADIDSAIPRLEAALLAATDM